MQNQYIICQNRRYRVAYTRHDRSIVVESFDILSQAEKEVNNAVHFTVSRLLYDNKEGKVLKYRTCTASYK